MASGLKTMATVIIVLLCGGLFFWDMVATGDWEAVLFAVALLTISIGAIYLLLEG